MICLYIYYSFYYNSFFINKNKFFKDISEIFNKNNSISIFMLAILYTFTIIVTYTSIFTIELVIKYIKD